MLKFDVSAVRGAPLSNEARLCILVMEGGPKLRSTDVLAVCRDWGRWKGLELVSEVVGVVDDVDQPRTLRVRTGCSGLSGIGGRVGSATSRMGSWIVK